jgi:hypothetical protein
MRLWDKRASQFWGLRMLDLGELDHAGLHIRLDCV